MVLVFEEEHEERMTPGQWLGSDLLRFLQCSDTADCWQKR